MKENDYYDMVTKLLVELEHYFDNLKPPKKASKEDLVKEWLESRKK